MRSIAATCSIVTLALLVPADGAWAQESTTRGFTIGIHASGASLMVENQDRNNAGGGGIHAGYGFNRTLTILAQLDGAQFDEQRTGDVQGDWTLGHFDVGVRFHFANSLRSLVPYLQGTIGVRAVTVIDPIVNNTAREAVSISGSGVTLGGGLNVYLKETLALDVQLLWTGGKFTTLHIDNVSTTGFDVDATSSRFNVGLSWWP